jgi:ribonuclease III
LNRLSQRLGHTFSNSELLQRALAHRSIGKSNNERLEYLGDAILSFVISDVLYSRFSGADEGQLSRLRASLVKGDTLAKISQELDVGPCLQLGPGELKSGGHRRASILADAFEALIGAVYLDSDEPTVRRLILKLFAQRIDEIDLDQASKDPKTRLQEFLQARRRPLPEYQVLKTEGHAHNQTFHVRCEVVGLEAPLIAQGGSRRKAEQAVAQQALEKLKNG